MNRRGENMYIHLFRLDTSGDSQINYYYIITNDNKMSIPLRMIKKFIRYQLKRHDIPYNYEYVGPIIFRDGLLAILNHITNLSEKDNEKTTTEEILYYLENPS